MIVTAPGNPVQTWAPTVHRAQITALASLAPAGIGTRLLVVSAHPDDETIGAGRLIACWASAVGPVSALTLTAGEACLANLKVVVADLAGRRLAEWRAAVTALGAQAGDCWAVPDGQVATELDLVADRLAERCAAGDVILAPWRHDPHPDHAAAGAAAAVAAYRCGATLVEYPVWMTYWSEPSILERTSYRVVQVAVPRWTEGRRSRALAQYRSQQLPLRADLTPVVPPQMLAHHYRQLALCPVRSAHA
jgi:LmbE family N-acetylglucosaminyl deacetylase